MCGICGIFRPDGAWVDPDRVLAMRDTMIPRGPDGSGLKHGPGFALGHRRLAIMDLSPAGRQPMSNEDGTVVTVFNGEVYNFLELRRELEAEQHEFRSRSDTEVLLHGYESWGIEGLLKRVRGMYAFALFDMRKRCIHLARDPVGKKPLFYRWANGELAFASSARALVQGLNATPDIDPLAIDDLMWNSYIPGPRTIFLGVNKLLPGRAWSLGQDGEARHFAHWEPDFLHPEQGVRPEEWVERVEDTLAESVKRRIEADVPVGILLSGGVDSGLIAALAAKATGRIRTFTVANEDPRDDESKYAESVARRYGAEHHVLPVRSDVRKDLPQLVAAMGEPMADDSAANLLPVARLARESVTVVLTGDGGDEGFGGYPLFWASCIAERARKFLPPFLRPLLGSCAVQMRRGPGVLRRVGTVLRLAALPLEETLSQYNRTHTPICRDIYTPEFNELLGERHPAEHVRRALAGTENGTMPDRVMQAHWKTTLADEFLPKVDLATMGASLEARSPFLDVDLLELAMRIPAAIRFHGSETKGLLRHLARRHLPAEVVNRRKQGFGAPIHLWTRAHWSDLIDDLVLGPHVEQRGWFRRDMLCRVVHEQRQGGQHARLLWALLVLELWIRLTIDRTLTPEDTL